MITLDKESLLIEADGSETIAAIEASANRDQLTLDVEGAASMTAVTLESWVASGMPGVRPHWRDPADHAVAGFEASRVNMPPIVIRPSPRRSVGPDLFALLAGCEKRFFSLKSAWLRVHHVGVKRPEAPAFRYDERTPPSEAEESLLDAIAHALQETR